TTDRQSEDNGFLLRCLPGGRKPSTGRRYSAVLPNAKGLDIEHSRLAVNNLSFGLRAEFFNREGRQGREGNPNEFWLKCMMQRRLMGAG
ncbi:MAG TPA: hypothetical protein VMD30_02735, partial [Tepidisphaeraceae bacterium]|nr:hypothetical protein [Tepidisphaeraceae bacterium]